MRMADGHVRFVIDHDVADCIEEFDAHDDHSECENVLHNMNTDPGSDFPYDPTGCHRIEECDTCGYGRKSCTRFNEPPPVLDAEGNVVQVLPEGYRWAEDEDEGWLREDAVLIPRTEAGQPWDHGKADYAVPVDA